MSLHALLRGVAVPYNRPRDWRGIVRAVAPGAFAGFIESRPRVRITWGSHDDAAPVVARTACLFEIDDVGLVFEAEVNVDWRSPGFSAVREASGGRAQASIGPNRCQWVAGRAGGTDCDMLAEASLDHIAILPAGETVFDIFAPVWRAPADHHDFLALSWSHQELNERFEIGFADHQARAEARRREERQAAKVAAEWGTHIKNTPLSNFSPQLRALALRGVKPPPTRRTR